jgi:hypothetical protein
MTIRTVQWLKDNFPQHDPDEWTEDLVDSVLVAEDQGTSTDIWVSKDGSDTEGVGSVIRPFATIAKGFAEVTAARSSVIVFPGLYEENVTWPKVSSVHLICLGAHEGVKIKDTSAGGTPVVKIAPGTAHASWKAFIDGIDVLTNGTGILIDNGSAIGTFFVGLYNSDIDQDAGTHALRVLHNATAHPVLFEADDAGNEIEGKIYLEIKHPEDRYRFRGMRLTGGLETSTDSGLGGTAEIAIFDCEIPVGGISGGSSAQLLSTVYSWTRDGKTYAKVVTSDLDGSHAENILG